MEVVVSLMARPFFLTAEQIRELAHDHGAGCLIRVLPHRAANDGQIRPNALHSRTCAENAEV
jgi:hypothetical protein